MAHVFGRLLSVALLCVLTAAAGCAPVWRDTALPMTPVATLDLQRYAGRWYEVARFPVIFQQGCTATTAEYALRPDGRLSVVNSCRRDSPDGPPQRIAGSAEVVGPGQLSVRLGRVPFAGPYWVLWVAPDYGTAVVGVPSGRAGWVLHRSPAIPPARLAEALAVLRANGYDTDRLVLTEH
jgi:apolipoprotein D and lipocalin family protein